MALLVNAVKELDSSFDWMGEYITKTATGIVGVFKELTVDKLSITGQVCVDDVCVDKEQFKEFLRQTGAEDTEDDED